MRSAKSFVLTCLMAFSLLVPFTAAHAETMTWEMINKTSSELSFRFFDEDSIHTWPEDRSNVYFVPPFETRKFTLACHFVGEQICFGGRVDDDPSQYYGAGLKGQAPCDKCCFICSSVNDPQPRSFTLSDSVNKPEDDDDTDYN